jgi:hypothetical protein
LGIASWWSIPNARTFGAKQEPRAVPKQADQHNATDKIAGDCRNLVPDQLQRTPRMKSVSMPAAP